MEADSQATADPSLTAQEELSCALICKRSTQKIQKHVFPSFEGMMATTQKKQMTENSKQRVVGWQPWSPSPSGFWIRIQASSCPSGPSASVDAPMGLQDWVGLSWIWGSVYKRRMGLFCTGISERPEDSRRALWERLIKVSYSTNVKGRLSGRGHGRFSLIRVRYDHATQLWQARTLIWFLIFSLPAICCFTCFVLFEHNLVFQARAVLALAVCFHIHWLMENEGSTEIRSPISVILSISSDCL